MAGFAGSRSGRQIDGSTRNARCSVVGALVTPGCSGWESHCRAARAIARRRAETEMENGSCRNTHAHTQQQHDSARPPSTLLDWLCAILTTILSDELDPDALLTFAPAAARARLHADAATVSALDRQAAPARAAARPLIGPRAGFRASSLDFLEGGAVRRAKRSRVGATGCGRCDC